MAAIPIELKRLDALWAAEPSNSCFAALAEGLRKRGSLEDAARVAMIGVAAAPGFLPGHIVRARILVDRAEWDLALAALDRALALDGTHPVALAARDDLMRHLAGPVQATLPDEESPADLDAGESPTMVYSDAAEDEEGSSPIAEPVMTESLAMIYRGQGHLAQAVDVLDALVARTPGNADLVARRDAWRTELELASPRPFDASRSGGRPVREWLASIASAAAPAPPPASSFDAFYQAPTPAAAADGDLAAFQAWLRELER